MYPLPRGKLPSSLNLTEIEHFQTILSFTPRGDPAKIIRYKFLAGINLAVLCQVVQVQQLFQRHIVLLRDLEWTISAFDPIGFGPGRHRFFVFASGNLQYLPDR